MTAVSGACSTASFGSAARQWAGEIVVLEITTRDGGGQERADGRGDGAGELVVLEAPAAVGARGQDHAESGRKRRSEIH